MKMDFEQADSEDGHNLEELQRILEDAGDTVSSADIESMQQAVVRMQNRLARAKRAASARERKERIEQRFEERRRAEIEEQRAREAHVAEVTSMELPLDWENAFSSDPLATGASADSTADALVLSLANLGRVDIEYIAQVSGVTPQDAIRTLEGSIFQNPDTWGECFYKGWETAEEYLSGNLMRKLKAARVATEQYEGYFDGNVRAIKKVLPAPVTDGDIYVTLGSPWVPPDVIDDFIVSLFGSRPGTRSWDTSRRAVEKRAKLKTAYDEITGTWQVFEKGRYGPNDIATTQTFGTNRMNALHILERTLNMRSVAVTDEAASPAGKTGAVRIVNRAETALALEKQRKLIEAFQDWVWTDPYRRKRLRAIYDERYGFVRRRQFDGSFLQLPAMSPDVSLRPHQKDAVARIIFSKNTLLAHDVGTGKTYIMIAAGMELRRMGLAHKCLYVVPNNIVGQWMRVFAEMYPAADVMCVEPSGFSPARRRDVIVDMRDSDRDAIVIAYSCLERIGLSPEFRVEEVSAQIERIDERLRGPDKATSNLKSRRKRLRAELESLMEEARARRWNDDGEIFFDELGVDRLFVDEAHNFKNVPLETKADRVLGVNATGSKRCRDMLGKVRAVQQAIGGGGIVFATGTPVTNSVADAYVMQLYLQGAELAAIGLQSFDGWLGMFAERSTGFEIDVDTSSYRLATRFSRFHNLPELTALLSSVADFHAADGEDDVPRVGGRIDVPVGRSPDFAAYLEEISRRADAVRAGRVSRRADNMLKITSDGRKAALDMRLVNQSVPFREDSKAARCAANVARIYFETDARRCTQLVFCDVSTPKAGFNLYDELRRLLEGAGIPAPEIAYVHDAKTEAQRSTLFARVRSGEVRVLVGSTFKLGMGVNVQDRLIALHHLDVPWRPSDMVQREGRILRQGNMNPEVRIYRYVTEGSFDAYSWQLLETKQRFISELLAGSLDERDGADVDDTVLSYAEVKALAVGNPLVKERVEAANELMRLRALERKRLESRQAMEQELLALPTLRRNFETRIAECAEDAAAYENWSQAHSSPEDAKSSRARTEERAVLRARIRDALDGGPNAHPKTLLNYCGFDIVVPSSPPAAKPFVWLVRAGRYKVELGESQRGYLVRIDNALASLGDYLSEQKQGLADCAAREQDLRAELARGEGYATRIEEAEAKLAAIDEQLGVEGA